MLVFEKKAPVIFGVITKIIGTFSFLPLTPLIFKFFSRKFRRALLENTTSVPLIFITDSDRTISTFQQQKEKKTYPFRNLLLFYLKL